MYIQLDVGWLHHPFPVSRFKVVSAEQIATLRGLGLEQVRCYPDKSDPGVLDAPTPSLDSSSPVRSPAVIDSVPPQPEADSGLDHAGALHQKLLEAQNSVLDACDLRFQQAMQQYLTVEQLLPDRPVQARQTSETLVADCVDELLTNGDSVIRLLSEAVGERSALHPVNVLVISLLLGKALQMDRLELNDVGIAALLHDIGKLKLPAQVRQVSPAMSAADRLRYESHVGESVASVVNMGLNERVVTAIAQHHEMANGLGFPLKLPLEDLSKAGQVVALVNQYDRMCNPVNASDGVTPHEALSVIFAQLKSRFDPLILGAFIRMMGVYPPGSIVQLVDDRYAIVTSVNSSRPLRPKIMVYDPSVPKEQALILDLERVPELGIRRSLKPQQLPGDILNYLSPRERICYFFERAVRAGSNPEGL